jgi:HK97 family phage prohead protease
MSTIMSAMEENDFSILKASNDDLMIGGYASIEMVDKQNDLITLKALNEAVKKFMEHNKFRNVMTNHSNVQVGEVVESHRDSNGKLWKTQVDDVGFFVVIKLRDDIEKAKEINRGIRKGSLRSFSIGGQALQKVKKHHDELGEYSEISKLELHEVTICEKGINPEARFDILKEDKTMNKLEKALAELDTLLEEVNTLRKEEQPLMERGAPHPLDEKMDEYMDTGEEEGEEGGASNPLKATTKDGNDETNLGGAGEPMEQAGAQAAKEGMVSKNFANDEFRTLNLSVSNIEKAYEQYRAEQLEKMGLETLEETFAKRFASEETNRADIVAKAEYDAQSEIARLNAEFSELRKSLTEEKNTIRKATEAATTTKVFSTEEIADMSWSDIHKAVGGNI